MIRVAVGVVENKQGEILIAKRPGHVHQGNLWEFPGGKVEAGESVEAALIREFKEEVSLQLHKPQALMTVKHDYGDKQVCLEIMLCREFTGEAKGMEGQSVCWVAKNDLPNYEFPAANQVIIDKLLASPES